MGKVICCLALFLALPLTSAIRRLNSVDDLKNIAFGRSVPKHSLLLLHWFANAIDMDVSGGMTLAFDHNSQEYGSHHYGNFEGILPQSGYKYYTIGNINQDTSGRRNLPDYVINPRAAGYNGGNRDRVIVEVTQTSWMNEYRIRRVYITQHYGNSEDTTYDEDHTYEITPNLLREIRGFSATSSHSLRNQRDRYSNQIPEIGDIMNIWGHVAGLGLLLLTVFRKTSLQGNMSFKPQCASYTSTNTYGNYSGNSGQDECGQICGFFLVAIIVCFFLAFLVVKNGKF